MENTVGKIAVTKVSKNLFDSSKTVSGYLDAVTGAIRENASRFVSDYMRVTPGKYVTASILNTIYYTRDAGTMASICFFNEQKGVVSGGAVNIRKLIVPDNAAYVRVCFPSNMRESLQIELTDDGEVTSYEPYYTPYPELKTDTIIPTVPLGYMRAIGDMTDGSVLHVNENNVKNEVVVAFSANVTTFDKIFVGQRHENNNEMRSCYLEIDNTNVILHTDQGTSTAAHGLTITGNIQVLIRTEKSVETSLIRVVSNGEAYEDATPHRWICDQGFAAAVSVGSTLTDCVLSWTSRRINAPIWIFGDSYISLYAQRWVYYLLDDGFDNVLLNGFAGEESVKAVTALDNLFAVAKPKYILWALGMNNADGDSAANGRWKYGYDHICDICNRYSIIPIFATIPTTPTANNRYKNAIIRESGYRYIDFAKILDPSGDGSWTSGPLCADGTHTTAAGARVSYQQALADFPELSTLSE